MRRLSISLIAAVMLLAGFSVAKADTFSVFADLPVAASVAFEGNSDVKSTGVSGYKVGVTFPIFLGLAMEDYVLTLNQSLGDYKVSLFDVFFNLPLPIVNIAAGIGVGGGSFEGSPQQSYNEAPLTQVWASLGFNVLPLLDIHVGYHSFKGRHNSRNSGGSDLNVSGTMTSVGAKLGF